MCGISALVSKKGQISEGQLSHMSDALKHRGPDDSGFFVSSDRRLGLAHRRLSLVDLSERGKQPMTKHGRTITFNGEIYNFRQINKELKEKGYIFTSHSDTETILSAFEEWGIECLKKFNGAFAFILHDHVTGEVYAVRDRIGEKPLYFTETDKYFIFASEIKAIRKISGVNLQPDIDTIRMNFIFHFWSDKERTYFKNVFSLSPGTYMRIRKNHPEVRRYWDIQDLNTDFSGDIDTYTREIYELLEDAVQLRLSADCKVGSLLSGGIDSSLITAIAAKRSTSPLQCFTLCVKNTPDEDSANAKELLKVLDNARGIEVEISKEIFSEENLDRLTLHLEEVVLNRISLYVNTNYAGVKKLGLKTVLNGQGSDEISLGYYHYYNFLQNTQNEFEYDNFVRFWLEQFSLKRFMDSRMIIDLIQKNLQKNYLPYVQEDVLNSVSAFGIKTHLLNILNHEDRFSMAEGVECRTVFTDYRIIEKFMTIPSKYKILDSREKYLIRKLSENILPKTITTRKKMGFPDFSQDYESALVSRIMSRPSFWKSELINQVFNSTIFPHIGSLPSVLQWKLAALHSFERVFLN